ncbi:MAG: multiheme c-type cytochrome [Planctomycetota bacterium]|jgi:hypothetical protein
MKQLITCICVLNTLEGPRSTGTQILAKAKKKVIGVLFLMGLTVVASCELATSTKPQAKSVDKTDELTIFLTGNELSALKPCGCSGGQLGGLERRWAVLNSVPKQKRLIVDTGSFVKSDSEQELIKFNIIIEAFRLLDYDVVNLSEKDIEICRNLGLLDSIGSIFNIISSHGASDVNMPVKFTKRLSLKGQTVVVTVAAFNAKSDFDELNRVAPIEQIEQLFTPHQKPGTAEHSSGAGRGINILILNHCDPAIINSIAERVPIVDCLVCPADSDEPRIIGDPNKRPLVFSVGRFGRYVSRLQIRTDKNKLKLSFLPIPIKETLEQESSLVELYKDYQQFVKESNLLEKYPRVPLPNGLEYTGSESCMYCHDYEYQKWKDAALREPGSEAHAHAYATLEQAGSQFDPECVICHVVGMEYESGFVSEEKTSHLKNVGCENCHGPGSEHIRTLGIARTTEPKSVCLDCHTPEQSGDYAGNERSFLEKIIHWGEPNAVGHVK